MESHQKYCCHQQLSDFGPLFPDDCPCLAALLAKVQGESVEGRMSLGRIPMALQGSAGFYWSCTWLRDIELKCGLAGPLVNCCWRLLMSVSCALAPQVHMAQGCGCQQLTCLCARAPLECNQPLSLACVQRHIHHSMLLKTAPGMDIGELPELNQLG